MSMRLALRAALLLVSLHSTPSCAAPLQFSDCVIKTKDRPFCERMQRAAARHLCRQALTPVLIGKGDRYALFTAARICDGRKLPSAPLESPGSDGLDEALAAIDRAETNYLLHGIEDAIRFAPYR